MVWHGAKGRGWGYDQLFKLPAVPIFIVPSPVWLNTLLSCRMLVQKEFEYTVRHIYSDLGYSDISLIRSQRYNFNVWAKYTFLNIVIITFFFSDTIWESQNVLIQNRYSQNMLSFNTVFICITHNNGHKKPVSSPRQCSVKRCPSTSAQQNKIHMLQIKS